MVEIFDVIIDDARTSYRMAKNIKKIKEITQAILIDFLQMIKDHYPKWTRLIKSLVAEQNTIFDMVLSNTKGLANQRIVAEWFIVNFLFQIKKIPKK